MLVEKLNAQTQWSEDKLSGESQIFQILKILWSPKMLLVYLRCSDFVNELWQKIVTKPFWNYKVEIPVTRIGYI